MCGIYGSTTLYDDGIIRRKIMRAGFRGPDYNSFNTVDNIVLGHSRLAIVDLEERSNQPFNYLHLRIVFNGEIYNYKELRNQLIIQGFNFKTSSDTEVLAATYLAYGENCVNHLNGMFAFVIHDQHKNIMFGARDRLGKKPFYFFHEGKNFEFASQPSQIAIGRALKIDEFAINQFFLWSYIPEPRSAWLQIKKLNAGEFFRFCIDTGKFEISRYWDYTKFACGDYAFSYSNAIEDLNNLLANAVHIRLNADVELGVFLSGGIDSSVIAGLAATERPVKTFCVKFKGKKYDESIHAQKVAEHLGTKHYSIECDHQEGLDIIKNMGRYYDEPFADFSAIPSLLLSKYIKPHVTVALSGDGGDEAFYGYHRYARMKKVAPLYNLPNTIRKVTAGFFDYSANYKSKLMALGLMEKDLPTLYIKMFGGLDYSWMTCPHDALNIEGSTHLYNSDHSLLQRMSTTDILTYLNGDINTKVDRSSMANAVEIRSPFMDHRVIEFARHLPDSYKYHQGHQKRILKDILQFFVPRSYFDRPKAGFTLPLGNWLKNELREYVMDELSLSSLKQIPFIIPEKAYSYIQQHMTGKWNRSLMIWKLMVFKQWQTNFNDN